ncbi:hypothetical protein [Luteimonas sp. A478]
MTGPEIEALRCLAALTPDCRDVYQAHLTKQLPDLGECIATRMTELARDPTPEKCDAALQTLSGVMTHIRQIKALEVTE